MPFGRLSIESNPERSVDSSLSVSDTDVSRPSLLEVRSICALCYRYSVEGAVFLVTAGALFLVRFSK
jgi:hypothetical protein